MALPSPLSIAAGPSGVFLVEETVVERRWQAFSLPPLHSRDYRLAKAGRNVRVLAAHPDWTVSNISASSDASTTPYVVKDGDTLTSIAKKSKTSVRLLADTNSISDLDFLLSGQLLYVPAESEAFETSASHTVDDDEFPIRRGYDPRPSPHKSVSQQHATPDVTDVKTLSSRGILQKVEGSHLAASVRPAPGFSFPRLAVPILLIAPLLGFCIRCIVDALYIHMDREEAKHQAEKEAWELLHRPKTKRWQNILDEDRDGIEPASSSTEGSAATNAWGGGDVWTPDANVREKTWENSKIETEEEIGLRHKQDYEDIRKSYAELESTYAKFLADSGMSKSGYWRSSGLPTSARLDDGEPR